LIDSRGDIAAACNFTLEQAGRAALSEEEISSFVGDGARALVERAFRGDLDRVQLERELDVFLDYYTQHPVRRTFLLPGVQSVLGALSDRPLAVCTNKARKTTLPVLHGMGLAGAFRVVVAGGDCATRKPAPEMLLLVAEQLGCHAAELVMVGDGPQDVLGARAVGAHAVGVKGGLLPLERLVASEPDGLLEDMTELPEYLSRNSL
jgi:phosphoglycolate phosphatase